MYIYIYSFSLVYVWCVGVNHKEETVMRWEWKKKTEKWRELFIFLLLFFPRIFHSLSLSLVICRCEISSVLKPRHDACEIVLMIRLNGRSTRMAQHAAPTKQNFSFMCWLLFYCLSSVNSNSFITFCERDTHFSWALEITSDASLQ